MKPAVIPENLAPLYTKIDSEIRAGKFARARRSLRIAAEDRDIPREEAPWFAELYRRVGQSEFGTRLLFRYVHPSESESARVRATDHELAEYGGGLIRLYAIRDAERVLARLPDNDSRKHYFLAFARIHEWDYARALVLLRKHEVLAAVSPYVSLIARVNLADCLVETGDFHSAEIALESCLRDVRAADAKLLEANTLELIAKKHVYAGQVRAARKAIAEARKFLGPEAIGTADAFFLEKLERILNLRSSGKSVRAEFLAFQSRAKSAGQFEIARDIELYLAEFDRDETRYHSLYFGTPFHAYRRKIAESARAQGIEIPGRFLWSVPGAKGKGSKFTPKSPFIPTDHFKAGALLEHLFSGICADFYRPRRLLELYEAAYPNQIFNPSSSRNQVHQGLRRLRSAIRRKRLPFDVVEDHETYTLVARTPVTVLLRQESEPEQIHLERLGTFRVPFTSREAAECLGCSKNTAITILNQLREKEKILQTGQGPGTRYKIKGPKTPGEF